MTSQLQFSNPNSVVRMSARELRQEARSWHAELNKVLEEPWARQLQASLNPGEQLNFSNHGVSLSSKGFLVALSECGDNAMITVHRSLLPQRGVIGLLLDGVQVSELRQELLRASAERLEGKEPAPHVEPKIIAPDNSDLQAASLPARISIRSATVINRDDYSFGTRDFSVETDQGTFVLPDTHCHFRPTVTDKAFCRALGENLGILGQPAWVCPNVAKLELVRHPVLLADILKAFTWPDTPQTPWTVRFGNASISYRNEDSPIASVSKEDSVTTANPLSSDGLEKLVAACGSTVVELKKDEPKLTQSQFVEQARELGPCVYFKPRNSCQGNNIFRVSRSPRGDYIVDTDSLNCVETIVAILEKEKIVELSRWQRCKLPMVRFVQQYGGNLFSADRYEYHHPRCNFTLKLPDKATVERLLSHMDLSNYTAEEAIPIERLQGKAVEFRFVFQAAAEDQIKLTAHYAKVSGSLVTGNIAGGGQGADTGEVIRALLKQRGIHPAESDATLDDFFNRTERYMSALLKFFSDEQRKNPGVKNIVGNCAIDIVPVWDESCRKLQPYLMEINVAQAGQTTVGLKGLQQANPAVYEEVRWNFGSVHIK